MSPTTIPTGATTIFYEGVEYRVKRLSPGISFDSKVVNSAGSKQYPKLNGKQKKARRLMRIDPVEASARVEKDLYQEKCVKLRDRLGVNNLMPKLKEQYADELFVTEEEIAEKLAEWEKLAASVTVGNPAYSLG